MKRVLLKIPKWIALLLLIMVFPFSIYPQTFANSKELQRTGLRTSSVKLRDLVLELKNNYKVNILFEDKLLNDVVVSDSLIDFKKGIEQNLDALLSPVNLRYEKVKKNSYLIIPVAKEVVGTIRLDESAIPLIDDSELVINTETLAPGVVLNLPVAGVVKDENGVPLPGVNIIEKGTTNGTTSDGDGAFNIDVLDDKSILVFSFIGYLPEEVLVGLVTKISVSLMPDIQSLQEVVVIGYGSRERQDLMGAVADIGAKEITQSNALSPQLAMQGRMTGVLVTGGGGDPNARPNINIRGVTSFAASAQPLYVIDGVPVAEFGEGSTYSVEGARASDLRGTQNVLNLINPNDIESISVLKDASSAAVYGVRAANGVVLITTKRGKSGKPKVDFAASYGVRNLRKELEMLNTDQYTKIYQDQIFANDQFLDPTSSFLKYYDPNDPAYLGDSPTYDWQGEMVNKNAITSNVNVGISGGSEFSNYNIGAGYSKQEGSLNFNAQDRYSFSANSDFKIKKWLEVGESFRIAYTDMTDQRNNTGVENNLSFLLATPPWQAIYDANQFDGLANADPAKYGPETGINFVGMNTYTSQIYKTLRTLGSGYVTFIPLKGLRIKGSLGVDLTDNRRTSWSKGEQTARFNPTGNATLGNQYGLQYTTNISLITAFSVNYAKTFGDHYFDVLFNAEDVETGFNGVNTGVSNIPLDDPDTWTISAGLPTTVTSSQFKEAYALIGYLGRLSYKYKDKYYLDASVRRDGTSRFAPESRWGVFPAVSGAWRISGENFMSGLSFINDLKLKGGWGQLGNQDTRAYAFVSTVNRNAQYGLGNNGTGGAGNPNTAAFLGDYANKELGWEIVTTSSVGFDAALLSNALTVSVEYYNRSTDNILQGVAFPSTAGLNSSPIFNIASVYNRGVEVALSYTKNIGEIEFSIGGNLTTVKNRVTDLYQDQPLGGSFRIKEGKSINSIYGYQSDGIFQTDQEVTDWLASNTSPGKTTQLSPGDIRFRDIYSGPNQTGTPNGVVDGFDQTYLGKTIPGYYYGINLGANYKNFDLNLLFQGVGDVSKVNYLRMQGEYMGGPGNNWLSTTVEHWTPENKSNTMPRPIYSDPSDNNRFSSRWIENGSFFRLNNIQLGYTLPSEILSKIGGMSRVHFYVQSTNTFVITKYSGLDPENDNNPTPRAFILGLNASF